MANSGGTRLGVKRSLRRCRRVPFNLSLPPPPFSKGFSSFLLSIRDPFIFFHGFPLDLFLSVLFRSRETFRVWPEEICWIFCFIKFRSNHRTYFYQLFINFCFIRLFSISFAPHFHSSRNSNLLLTKQHVVDQKIFQRNKRYLCGKYTIYFPLL